MKKIWKYIKNIFSSDPERWPAWIKAYNEWIDKDGIWLFLLIFMLFGGYTTKLLSDKIEILEHRIKRVEEPIYKPKRDVALASDMIKLEHIMTYK